MQKETRRSAGGSWVGGSVGGREGGREAKSGSAIKESEVFGGDQRHAGDGCTLKASRSAGAEGGNHREQRERESLRKFCHYTLTYLLITAKYNQEEPCCLPVV